jgi:hypothetical protein
MPWSDLAMQFCLELAFGVLLALAFVPKAPVGVLFYRVMGTSALVPVLVAVVVPIAMRARDLEDNAVLFACLAILAYPIYSGPVRGRRWAVGLGLALVGVAASVALVVAGSAPEGAPLSALELLLATTTALATGAVAGSVGLAMVLGHWYLTVPKLEVRHLVRLNRVTVTSMVLSALLVGLSCLVFREDLEAGRTPLFGATGLFYLGTRLTVGLLFPLGFAAMAASSLRFQNTRSATGILYASTVLVLIGTAVSVSLQDTYGVPL